MNLRYYRFILIFTVCYFYPSKLISQLLDDKINAYMSSKEAVEQYDRFSDIMFGNSEYSFDQLISEATNNITKAQELEDKRYLSMAYSLMGDAYYLSGRGDSAYVYYTLQADCLIGTAQTSSEYTLVASGLGNAANTASTLGLRSQAIDLAYRALPYAVSIGDPRGEADLYYLLAHGYNSIIQADSAIHYFNKCYTINLASGDRRSIASNLLLIGGIYLNQGKRELALQSYRKALQQLPDSIPFRSVRSVAMSDIGSAYQGLGQIDSAIFYQIKAKEEANTLKNTNNKNRFQLKLINILIEGERLAEALLELKTLQHQISSQEDISVRIGSHLSCAKLQLKLKNYKSSELCLNQGLQLANTLDVKYYRSQLYPIAIELYQNQKNYKRALEFSQLNSAHIKEYNNNELEKTEIANNFQYELDKINQQNEISALENTVLTTQLSKRRLTIMVLSGLLLIALLSVYLLRQYFKNRERLKEQIQQSIIDQKEKKYLEKEMEALRAQMNPHFLFNSLNSINHYILTEDPRSASRYLTKFSQLMRSILSNSKSRYVLLSEELKALRLYCELENLRFEDRFSFHETIDVDTDDIYVPPLILQPFIENCIKHAFKEKKGGCKVSLNIQIQDNTLIMEISDNGMGRKRSNELQSTQEQLHKSYGLDITQERLELFSKLYNVKSTMTISDLYEPDGQASGTKVNVTIPILKNHPKSSQIDY